MNYITNIWKFIVKTWRVAKFLAIELWHITKYVSKETTQGFITFYRFRNACLITVFALAASWGAITDAAHFVAVRYDIPKITFASEIKTITVNEVVIQEGLYEQLYAEAEAEIRARKEIEIKNEATVEAKRRFDNEYLKAQLNFR